VVGPQFDDVGIAHVPMRAALGLAGASELPEQSSPP
jgi:hypothetical protein